MQKTDLVNSNHVNYKSHGHQVVKNNNLDLYIVYIFNISFTKCALCAAFISNVMGAFQSSETLFKH